MGNAPGRAVIGGAGPGGAALALVLASRGVRVTLLERHDDFTREFRGEWLNLSGRTALEQMGLSAVLASVPTLAPNGATVFVNGRELFTMRAGDSDAGKDHLLVSQPALLAEMVREAARYPNFTFVPETTVRGVIRERDRVVGVTGTRRGERVTHRGDVVIAADGRSSVLRRASGLRVAVDHDGRYDMLWFKAPPPADVDPEVGYQFLQRNGTAFTHPHPDGVHQYGCAFAKGGYADLRRDGAWLEAMCSHVPDNFAEHLRAIRDRIDPAFFNIVSGHLAYWYVPGMLVIGDAAHPMSAVGGQGINMALRDAVVVANLIGPLLRDGEPNTAVVDAAARAVATERVPEIARIQALQERGSKILNLETKAAQFMMERVLPLLGRRAAPLLARGVGTTREFTVGVTEVTLTF